MNPEMWKDMFVLALPVLEKIIRSDRAEQILKEWRK